MRHIVIDVETANERYQSICQIGWVVSDGPVEVETGVQLIDPKEEFSPFNSSIHGLSEGDVAGMPTFRDFYPRLSALLASEFVVSHSHFDKVAIRRACDAAEVAPIECEWLDSVQICRHLWPELSGRGGHGLKNLCDVFAIPLNHHDALDDARATAHLLALAIRERGWSIEEWRQSRAERTRHQADRERIAAKGWEGGPLSGETIVFTGALSIPRPDAAKMANALGATVGSSVTSQTTILVVGDQDLSRLAGKSKSGKHLKAESLRNEGHGIQIVQESDFLQLVSLEP